MPSAYRAGHGASRAIGRKRNRLGTFRQRADGHDVRRNLYKNAVGNSVVFEEVNTTLGLTFRYRWATSDAFGFIRTATLANDGDAASTSRSSTVY